jgi:hypothetical protein
VLFGRAPFIADAQFGPLSVGITPRASSVHAEREMRPRSFGTRAVETPSTLSPSTPMI